MNPLPVDKLQIQFKSKRLVMARNDVTGVVVFTLYASGQKESVAISDEVFQSWLRGAYLSQPDTLQRADT